MSRRWGLVVILGASLLGCGPADAQHEMSRAEFGRLFIVQATRELPGATFQRLDDNTVEVRVPGRGVERLSLETAYAEYLRDTTDADRIVGRLIATVADEEAALAADARNLVIVVRPQRPQVEIGEVAEASQLLSRPLAGDLVQVLAFDSPASIRYANARDLAVLKLNEKDAWARAMANLPDRIGRLDVGPMEDAADLIAINSESGLAPSALLLEDACKPGQGGRPVLVLARHFFVAPADQPEAHRNFWRLAQFEATSPEAFSRTPIVCADGKWAAAKPPTG